MIKAARGRVRFRPSIWILLTLFLLPIPLFGIWFNRQVRQQRLDHALIVAIKKYETKTAIALLDQGADANATDKPYTPMTLSNILMDFWNRAKGNRPEENRKQYPTALLLPYSRVEAVWYHNQSVNIYYERAEDNPELVEALLRHGANPSAQNEDDNVTILHRACAENHIGTVRVLMSRHINPDVTDHRGQTPLMNAHEDSLRLLIENGANVNAQDQEGKTSLMHYVLHSEESSKIISLLQQGARVSIKDRSSKTALDYARDKDNIAERRTIALLDATLKKEQSR